MFSFRTIRLLIIAFLVALPCFASEVAVLKNGFSIRHERREVVGKVTRLYVNAEGSSFVDVPTADIEHFEAAPVDLSSGSGLPAATSRLAPAKTSGFPSATGFPARPKTDLSQVINDASGKYRLDPDLVNSVIKAESAFNPRAVSVKGAQGLMQLMPGTASQLGVRNAFDAEANVDGGTKYLRELLERYNFDLVKALAAYNAGPQRVDRYGNIPPYYETRMYVRKIVLDFNKKKAAQQKAAASKTASSTKAARSAPLTAKATKAAPSTGVQAKASGASN